MSLRPYQRECLDAITEHAAMGITRQLIVHPTGCGKMVVAAHVPDALKLPRGKRMLFLTHRNELCLQAAEKLHTYNPALSVGMEKAEYRAGDTNLVVASVQTIGNGDRRISQFNPDDFSIIQVDEAHHISHKSKQWLAILRYFRVLKGEENEDKSKVLCGWSATPNRADSCGLEIVFDKIVHSYDIRAAINDGWLAPIIAYRVETEIDLSHVRTEMGDFSVPDLSSTVNTPERNELIARKYTELCPGRPALFFTVTVQHSIDLAETLRSKGFKIYPLSGKTPPDERARFLRMFHEGAIHGFTSCSVLSEGVDLPTAEIGFMARPTKSGLLFRQQVGRLLRRFPSPEQLAEMRTKGVVPPYIKPHAMIVDVCDVSGRHQLIETPSIFGLRSTFDMAGKDVVKTVEEIEQLEQEHPGLDLRSCANLDAIKQSLQKLDLLKPPETPEEIRRISKFQWLKESEQAYRLGLFDGGLLSIRVDTLGNFEIYRHVKGIRTKLWIAKSLKEALTEAEREIPDRDRQVMVATASWRREPPTDKQIGRLFYLDRKLRTQFRNSQELYQFALKRYDGGDGSFSRGQISAKISSLEVSRS